MGSAAGSAASYCFRGLRGRRTGIFRYSNLEKWTGPHSAVGQRIRMWALTWFASSVEIDGTGGGHFPRRMAEPPNDLMQTLMRSQGGTAFIQALGATITEVAAGRSMIRLPYSRNIVGNPDTGVVHGGVITGLLDHACGMAVGSGLGVIIQDPALRVSTSYATLDLRIDYMKAAKPGVDIVVVGECVKITRQIVFARGRAYQETEDNLIAAATGTFITTETRPGA